MRSIMRYLPNLTERDVDLIIISLSSQMGVEPSVIEVGLEKLLRTEAVERELSSIEIKEVKEFNALLSDIGIDL